MENLNVRDFYWKQMSYIPPSFEWISFSLGFCVWNAWWQFDVYCSVNLWLSDDSADKWWTKIKWNKNESKNHFICGGGGDDDVTCKTIVYANARNEPHRMRAKVLENRYKMCFSFWFPWTLPIEYTNRCRHDDRRAIGMQFMRFRIAKWMKHKRC